MDDVRAPVDERPQDATEPGPRMARRIAEREAKLESKKRRSSTKRSSFWRELPVLVVVALVLAVLVKTFLVQAFYIPSGSMEDTLRVGDRVLVDKLSYDFRDPRRGEVVVFNGVDSFTPEVMIAEPSNPVSKGAAWVGGLLGFPTAGERDFVKRVIGVPGDHVVCCDPEGRITVNDVPLDESDYLFPGDEPSAQRFDVTVPDGKLWVMGDHRSISQDSRSHLGDPGGGMVPIDNVIGRASLVVWPSRHWTRIQVPPTFEQPELQSSGSS